MKKIYSTVVLLALAMISFSQNYHVYTAQSSGLWIDAINWTVNPRMDGIEKNKVIIPTGITISANDSVNNLGLGNVQLEISGNLVIMAGTNLNFSSGSSIQLINGTITGLDANQKIKIGSDIKYKGSNDGIITGTFYTDANTGSSPSGFVALSTLPVNFTSFYISNSGDNIALNWSTDKEINNSHFEIERSFNGVDWQNIGKISASGAINNTNNYSYHDKSIASPVVYYRLRQVDINGRSIYSSIKTMRIGEKVSPVRIYGSDKAIVIDLNTSIKNNLVVTVLNTNGQVMSKQTITNPSYRINLSLSNVTTGTYIVHVTDNKGLKEVKKVAL